MAETEWTPEALSGRYEEIKSCIPQQLEAYARFLREAAPEDLRRWQQIAQDLKLELNLENGRIKYKKEFKPLELPVDICYIRHGKTQGNTEPRVFQGQVDYANNQLTQQGQQQAAAAATKLEAMAAAKEFIPDLLLSSPLLRAVHTAQPFVDANPKPLFRVLPELAEMAFGEWDNRKVAELEKDDPAHLFYLQQNAVIKAKGPHRICCQLWQSPEWLEGKKELPAENFLECLDRQRKALIKVGEIAKELCGPSCGERKPRVAVYGHSMAGAAVSVLLGFGKEDQLGFLGFDGNYIMPNATPTLLIPNAKP